MEPQKGDTLVEGWDAIKIMSRINGYTAGGGQCLFFCDNTKQKKLWMRVSTRRRRPTVRSPKSKTRGK